MVGDELTVARRDGKESSSACGRLRHGALPLRITLIMSSERSTSESSSNELSYSSPVLVLMLVPRLREGPARRWKLSGSWRDMEFPLEAPDAEL